MKFKSDGIQSPWLVEPHKWNECFQTLIALDYFAVSIIYAHS